MKYFFSKENEDRAARATIFTIYGLCFFTYFLSFSGLFSNSVSEWLKSHTIFVAASLLLLLVSWMIGIVSKSDLFGAKSFTALKFSIFVIQILVGLGAYDESISNWNVNMLLFYPIKETPGGIKGWVLILPTIIYILRTFFLRFQRIERMLSEIKSENEG